LALVFAAFLVSLTFERWTYYDDGGLGTAALVVLYTLGLPFLIPRYLFAILTGGNTSDWLVYLSLVLGLLSGTLFYIGLDRRSARWANARSMRKAEAARPNGRI
jgi:hypothetical protein